MKLAYENQRTNPNAMGSCWLEKSPAVVEMNAEFAQLKRLAATKWYEAGKANKEPDDTDTQVVVAENEAEVVRTEYWLVDRPSYLTTIVDAASTTSPMPPVSVEEFVRVYRLKKLKKAPGANPWKVYQVTSVPIPHSKWTVADLASSPQ